MRRRCARLDSTYAVRKLTASTRADGFFGDAVVSLVAGARESDVELMADEERQVSFEDILFYLQKGCLLDDIEHPNKSKFPHQRVLIIDIDGYAYLVPYAESDDEIFLKTVIPSRKATKQ